MFGFRRSPVEKARVRALEAALHDALALSEDNVVRISEVACGAFGCPDVVTALLIMGRGRKTVIHRVAKPLSTVALEDLLNAMAPVVDPRMVPLADALAALAGDKTLDAMADAQGPRPRSPLHRETAVAQGLDAVSGVPQLSLSTART